MEIVNKQTVRARAVQGSAALGWTSKKTEQVAVQLQIREGEDEGRVLTWYGSFSDSALGRGTVCDRTLESLRYMGWQGDEIWDLSTIGDDDADDVMIVIDHEVGQDGETRAKVSWVNKLGNGAAIKDRMDDGQARAFAAKMKGKVLALKQKQGGGSASKPSKPNGGSRNVSRNDQPPPHTDDDLGF
jgi:hypothetical protein